MGWLDDTTVVLTGGGSGLGRAIVDRFVTEGANVGVLEISELKAEQLQADHGDRVVVQVGDATSFDDNAAAITATIDAFGPLHCFVGNAGLWDYSMPLTSLPPEAIASAFDEVFRLNVMAYLLGARASVDALRETNGSMIFTASNAAFWPSGGGPLYVASKHAVVGLVKQLAYELAPEVRVNGVAPGGMPSDLRGPRALGQSERAFDSLPVDDLVAEFSPLERAIAPEDYAGHYVLLASRTEALTTTGSIHNCDGGIGVRGRKAQSGRR